MPRHEKMTLDHLSHILQESHEITQSWRLTAEPYGIFPSMARMIANGYNPGCHIRAKLGLPTMAPAPVCPKCGEVHTTRRCTKGRKPRLNWRWRFGMSEEELEERLKQVS